METFKLRFIKTYVDTRNFKRLQTELVETTKDILLTFLALLALNKTNCHAK